MATGGWVGDLEKQAAVEAINFICDGRGLCVERLDRRRTLAKEYPRGTEASSEHFEPYKSKRTYKDLRK